MANSYLDSGDNNMEDFNHDFSDDHANCLHDPQCSNFQSIPFNLDTGTFTNPVPISAMRFVGGYDYGQYSIANLQELMDPNRFHDFTHCSVSTAGQN